MSNFTNNPEDRHEIKAYANQMGWSDVEPYEVVEVRTPNKVMIRRMESEMTKAPKLIGTGGFAAHFDNHTQEWEITSNESYPVVAIRWSKAKKHWYDKYGQRYRMSDTAVKFYDNNF